VQGISVVNSGYYIRQKSPILPRFRTLKGGLYTKTLYIFKVGSKRVYLAYMKLWVSFELYVACEKSSLCLCFRSAFITIRRAKIEEEIFSPHDSASHSRLQKS